MKENQIMEPNPLRGVLCVLLGGCCWGFSGSCGQLLFDTYGVDPYWLTVVRMITAGSVSTMIVALRNPGAIKRIFTDKHDRPIIIIYGIFGLLFSQFTYLMAISYTNAGTATVLQYIGPVLIMVVMCVLNRRLPRFHEVVAVILVMVGTFLLATHGDPGTMIISKEGLFWGLTAAVSMIFYTMLPKTITPKYGSFMVTGLGTLIGGVAFFLMFRPWPLAISLPVGGWLAVCGMIVVGTLIAYPLYLQGVSDIGPVKGSMLASIEPVSATVLSVVWLGSSFVAMDFVGFACILTTVFLLAKPEKAKSGENAPNLSK